jgi:L-threonylcarbamoyladenylate synthase
MTVLTLTEDNEQEVIDESIKILNEGEVIAYPTESFYALGVIAADKDAVERLFKLKGRPIDKPLPVIVGDVDMLKSIVKEIPSQAEILISRYWPGPLTLIFESIKGLPVLLTGGTDKVAVRVPGHGFALALAKKAGFPITATSANPSSMSPATNGGMVRDYFGESLGLIVDGGQTPGGKPSTIVDVTHYPPRLIRQGRVSL